MWTTVLLSLAIAAVSAWLLLIIVLVVVRPSGARLTESARLLPDLLRLIRRLAGDGSLPRGVRWRLWFLLAYLASPIDLIPDFIPVLGYADDVIVVLAVLRSTARRAGVDALRKHWSGDDQGFVALCHLCGVSSHGVDGPAPDLS